MTTRFSHRVSHNHRNLAMYIPYVYAVGAKSNAQRVGVVQPIMIHRFDQLPQARANQCRLSD